MIDLAVPQRGGNEEEVKMNEQNGNKKSRKMYSLDERAILRLAVKRRRAGETLTALATDFSNGAGRDHEAICA